MSTQNRRTGTSITDAVYGKGRKNAKPKTPRREVDPRYGFSLASQLDPALRWKLERMAAGSRRKRKGAK